MSSNTYIYISIAEQDSRSVGYTFENSLSKIRKEKSIFMATVMMHCANFIIREFLEYRICRLHRVGELCIGGIE